MHAHLLDSAKKQNLGPIPCHFADWNSRKVEWAMHARHMIAQMAALPTHALQAAQPSDLMRLTRNRLKALADAALEQAQLLKVLFEPLEPDLYPPSAGRGPNIFHEHFIHLHRDWGWPTDENQVAFDRLRSLLPAGPVGPTLFLGAGACRLAYDFHMNCKPEMTLANDINPMLFLAAQKILSGGSVDLFEIPAVPTDAASVAVKRTLKAAKPVTGDFQFLLADATQSGIRTEFFEVVITSWLIDVMPLDIQKFFPIIHSYLKPGGIWLNTGPLLFKDLLAGHYTKEEVLSAVKRSGFALEHSFDEFIAYMDSPISRRRRGEQILGFRARRAPRT